MKDGMKDLGKIIEKFMIPKPMLGRPGTRPVHSIIDIQPLPLGAPAYIEPRKCEECGSTLGWDGKHSADSRCPLGMVEDVQES